MDKKISLVKKEGLNFLLIPLKESYSITFLILVKTGSEYEKENEAGISHFLEHMCFKGTKKRPNKKILSTELDSIGATYNAFTSHEYTGYFAKAAAEHLDEVLDIISDIYLNSLFEDEEINKERGVILEEKNYYEDTPRLKIEDLIFELLYKDQPAGRPIIGKEEVIKSLNHQDFVRYHNKHYTNEKTLIVLAGNFNSSKAVKKISKLMKNIKRGKGGARLKTQFKQTEPAVLIKHKKTDQNHFILAARAFNCFDDRRYTLSVLSTILGEGMSSRLFQKVREELGAAYYINSFDELGIDHGFLGIRSGVAVDKTEKVLNIIKRELDLLKNFEVSEEELKKAKNYIKGNLALSLETSNDYAFYHGLEYLIYNKVYTLEEAYKQIDKVSQSDIQKLAQFLFKPEKMNLALIGNYSSKEENKFKKIIS